MPFDPNKLKQRREQTGLTQEEAAIRAGWKRVTGRIAWAELEIGKYANPRISKLEAAAVALECLVDDLLTKAPRQKRKRSPDAGSKG
jgi:transcriptional regulator with XRE-family HTH domain